MGKRNQHIGTARPAGHCYHYGRSHHIFANPLFSSRPGAQHLYPICFCSTYNLASFFLLSFRCRPPRSRFLPWILDSSPLEPRWATRECSVLTSKKRRPRRVNRHAQILGCKHPQGRTLQTIQTISGSHLIVRNRLGTPDPLMPMASRSIKRDPSMPMATLWI